MPVITFDFNRVRAHVVVAGLMTIGVAAALAAPAAPMSASSYVGKAAPVLLARTFGGETIDLAALRGKVVVLNFWASWCGPCRSEMPALDALYRDYRDRGVVVIGLSADDSHDRKAALAAARGVSYLTGMLSEATTNGFGAPQVLPMTYIVAADGTLADVLTANRGALSAVQLRAAVDARLAATSPAP